MSNSAARSKAYILIMTIVMKTKPNLLDFETQKIRQLYSYLRHKIILNCLSGCTASWNNNFQEIIL